ncbi:putative invertase inhibitor [Carex rostrata]
MIRLKTCKNVTTKQESYDFCVTSLQAVPKSRSADNYELAVIGLQLCLGNHTYNLAKAKKLQEQPPSGSNWTKQSIDVCVEVYGSSLVDLNKAIENAQKKLPFSMDIATASIYVSTCKRAFEEAGEKDPLATENGNAFKLDSIMGAIDAMLHPRQ